MISLFESVCASIDDGFIAGETYFAAEALMSDREHEQ